MADDDGGHGQQGDGDGTGQGAPQSGVPAGQQTGHQAQQGDGGKPDTDWKAEARKWEQRAKDNAGAAKKLADIEAANQTELERAQAAAQAAEAKVAAANESIAAARLEAALTGLVDDPADVVADLNHGNFLTEDGQVDTEKVAALKTRYQALAPQGTRPPRPNPAQGSGGQQKTLGELIAEAEKSGDPRKSIAHKSRQLLELRNQQG